MSSPLLPRPMSREKTARAARLRVAAFAWVLLAAPVFADARTGVLEFVNFNTWNVNEPYGSRIEHAIEGLAAEAPDVIALEEIYLDGDGVPPRADVSIADALRMDRVSHAAATVPFGTGQATEGLALLSRHPIVASTYLQLPSPNGGSGRIVLEATISTPFGLVDCYATHLSTNANERDVQAQALFAFIESVPHQQPPVVLGDLNAVPTSLALLFLTGAISAGGTRGNLVDGWSVLHPGDPGPTFATANAPGQRLDRRFDYVLLGRGTAAEPAAGRWVESRRILDQPDEAGIYPSDHLAIATSIRFEGEPPAVAHRGGGCAIAGSAATAVPSAAAAL
ncbi:MAG: endonuclease/exonuclease/phosphatase family protein, partial [bacterium]